MMNVGSNFEIPVTDLERAMKFYSAVFGCELQKDSIHGKGNRVKLFQKR